MGHPVGLGWQQHAGFAQVFKKTNRPGTAGRIYRMLLLLLLHHAAELPGGRKTALLG